MQHPMQALEQGHFVPLSLGVVVGLGPQSLDPKHWEDAELVAEAETSLQSCT